MNNNFSYRTITILMTFLMFFSSIGITMDVPYCGGELENVSFFGKADQCEMMKEVNFEKEPHACCENKNEKLIPHCSKNDSDELLSKGKCCSNENYMLQTLDDGQTSDSFEITDIDLHFIALFVINKCYLFETEKKVIDYRLCRHPLLDYDVIIQHQSFLI